MTVSTHCCTGEFGETKFPRLDKLLTALAVNLDPLGEGTVMVRLDIGADRILRRTESGYDERATH